MFTPDCQILTQIFDSNLNIMMINIKQFIAFSDFEKFLISRANEWEIKLKEVEAKFLELGDMSDNHADVAGEPKRKKRKKNPSSSERPLCMLCS